MTTTTKSYCKIFHRYYHSPPCRFPRHPDRTPPPSTSLFGRTAVTRIPGSNDCVAKNNTAKQCVNKKRTPRPHVQKSNRSSFFFVASPSLPFQERPHVSCSSRRCCAALFCLGRLPRKDTAANTMVVSSESCSPALRQRFDDGSGHAILYVPYLICNRSFR